MNFNRNVALRLAACHVISVSLVSVLTVGTANHKMSTQAVSGFGFEPQT